MVDGTATGERKDILCENISSLFTAQRYSDFSVHCGLRSWKVHKSIVCARSTYFEKACAGGFKEASEGSITLPDDEPSIINAVLMFLYSADYDDGSNKAELGLHPLSFDVQVYAAADKYDLNDLGQLAMAKFAGRASSEWNTPAFADAVDMIYTGAPSCNSALRTKAVGVIRENAVVLLVEDTGVKIREIICSTPQIGLDLAVALVMQRSEPKPQPVEKSYRCGRFTRGQMCSGILKIAAIKGTSAYSCPVCRKTSDGSYLVARPA